MGRDFCYQIERENGSRLEEEELYWARNTVEWMHERRFSYEELKEYIISCLKEDDKFAVKTLGHVLAEMDPTDIAIISSC